jgi:DNA-directed RNA polymerase sigma subunit (sigma70/sigma32)
MVKVVENKEVVKSFSDALKSLSEKEQLVISKRLGINGKKETLQFI